MFQKNQVQKINMLLTVSILIMGLMSSVWGESNSPDISNTNCGRVYTSNSNRSAEGWIFVYQLPAEYGSAPWSVGIYSASTDESVEPICGGTIISLNLVVTAAYCMVQGRSADERLMISGKYKIAVGKYTSNISITDNEFTQIIDVEKLYLKNYTGLDTFYVNNIAVIALATKIKTSNTVLPACVDWTARFNVPNESVGKLASWRQTKNLVSSLVLMEKFLPFIDRETCRNWYTAEKNNFKQFITNNTFCAGSVSVLGRGIQDGDGGSGLTFVHNDKHFLIGIAGLKDPQSNKSVAVFTDVRKYTDWLQEIYMAHNIL